MIFIESTSNSKLIKFSEHFTVIVGVSLSKAYFAIALMSLIATFGTIIALISCSCGYAASGGAKGVGEATTKSVVWSFVAIVIVDMFFAIAFFF